MHTEGKCLWKKIGFAFLLILLMQGRVLAEEATHHDMQEMVQQMGMPERGAPSPVPAGTISQKAGTEMMNRMMNRLDQEIDRAGGKLGGFTAGSQAHATMQGIPLQISNEESVKQGGRCPDAAPVKTFDISAVNVEITLSRFLDYFPGYLYVLTEELDQVRAEEAKNKAARESNDPYPAAAVSTGQQGDMIAPLTIRANAGDCVRITLRNKLESEEPVSFHLHGSNLIVKTSGQAATMTNKDALVAPGKFQEFEWYIPADEQDKAHQFHSHAIREHWNLGMFGSLVVEPRGSRYLNPWTGKELKSGWMAMIDSTDGPDFREFAVWYHEIGDEVFRILDKKGEMLGQRDPVTDAYRPGGRGLNLRSEPHGTRLALQVERHGIHDESMAYGSYTFGDPATMIPRSYVGDPVKFRMMGGSETIHSHHLHSGAGARWPLSPNAVTKAEFDFAATRNGTGPVKFPPIRTSSERVDVQSIGAAESYNQEIECGSGGCQYGAGDHVYHCHIPQHYVTGMWAFWRVYNTLQTADSKDDVMPPLAELPDRKGMQKLSVDSAKLVGTTVDWFGGTAYKITSGASNWKANPPEVNIKEWVQMMLPPQGLPGGTEDEHKQAVSHDGSVFDWKWDGNTALHEPETKQVWVNYKSANPGKRLPFRFDPKTGKLSIPWNRPHLGKRVNFTPEHNGAPFLEPIRRIAGDTEPATPGEQGPWSLCPDRSPRKAYTVNGIELPITLKKATAKTPAIVDPDGLLYVLEDQEAAIRANDDLKNPLVIRANVYDCVDVIYKSKMSDSGRTVWSNKTNIHPHFFQFDITASDGVIVGFNWEQSVRPFTIMKATDKEKGHEHDGLPVPQNTRLAKAAKAGDTSVEIESNVRHIDIHGTKFDAPIFQTGVTFGLDLDGVDEFEAVKVKEIKGNTVVLTRPLKKNHKKGGIASVEFVRYRWYPDVDLGIVFWHDHVFGLDGWGHGFFSATVVEPPGSTYHDPTTGKEIRSGHIADIHTTDPVGHAVKGSFRELVSFVVDSNPRTSELITADNPMAGRPSVDGTPSAKYPARLNKSAMAFLNGGEATTGGGYGMRAEPLSVRLANNPDPSKLFSSKVHGDPETPILRAYLGDPIVVRLQQGSANEAHTWHLSGHYFPLERYNPDSKARNTMHIIIGERFNFVIPAAGGPQKMAGDYLYYSGRASHFAEGSWGMIRVLDKPDKNLRFLPSREEIPASAKELCPADAPVKEFGVSAIDHAMKFNKEVPEAIEVDLGRKLSLGNQSGKAYVLDDEVTKVKGGMLQPNPLTLRVNVGDCIKIKLTNRMAKERAGFHADMLAFDPKDSMGINVGNNPGDQTVAPGQSKTYTFYAHPEYGENAALIQDWGNVVDNPRNGLYGAIVVGPKGSKYRDPATGADISTKNAWQADVIVDRGIPGNENKENYRDFALMFQEEDNLMNTSFMPYAQKIGGLIGVNYRAAMPMDHALEVGCNVGMIFQCVSEKGGVATPIIEAHAGDKVLIHVLGAFMEQVGVFALDGHEWPVDSFKGAHQHSAFEFGGNSYLRIDLRGGAGGPHQLPGDYVYMNHRPAYADAGQWGLLRVLPKGDKSIQALNPINTEVRPVSVGSND